MLLVLHCFERFAFGVYCLFQHTYSSSHLVVAIFFNIRTKSKVTASAHYPISILWDLFKESLDLCTNVQCLTGCMIICVLLCTYFFKSILVILKFTMTNKFINSLSLMLKKYHIFLKFYFDIDKHTVRKKLKIRHSCGPRVLPFSVVLYLTRFIFMPFFFPG